jgi:rod shape-determining protein MreD
MVLTGISLFLPMLVALLLLLGSSVPVDIAGSSAFFPAVDVMAIYFWATYRPATMPYWFVFVLGILRDSLDGVVFGVSSCIYLVIRLLVVMSRKLYRKDNFIIAWQGFAVILFIAILLKWALVSFVMYRPLTLDYAIMQFMLSVAIYPLLYWFFNLVNIVMPEKFQDD